VARRCGTRLGLVSGRGDPCDGEGDVRPSEYARLVFSSSALRKFSPGVSG
jgi:hypothetical protein